MLTERRIRDAKPEPKTRFLWDGQVKNLGVRVTPKGAKSFVLFYRTGGRKHLATLARCSEISLKGRSGACRPGAGRHPRRRGRPIGAKASRTRGADRQRCTVEVLR